MERVSILTKAGRYSGWVRRTFTYVNGETVSYVDVVVENTEGEPKKRKSGDIEIITVPVAQIVPMEEPLSP